MAIRTGSNHSPGTRQLRNYLLRSEPLQERQNAPHLQQAFAHTITAELTGHGRQAEQEQASQRMKHRYSGNMYVLQIWQRVQPP